MERNSFSNSLKDSSTGNNAIKDNYMLKDSLTSSNNGGYREDYLCGLSWPPRSYACSFCKREFRSAQALGGHMNVHRRDRARLRQSPPRDHHGPPPFLNFSLNPNPNPTLSSSSLVPSPCSSTFPSLLVSPPLSSLSSPSPSFPCDMKKWRVNGTLIDPLSSKGSDLTNMNKGAKPIFGVKELKDHGCNNKFLKKKKIECVNLDVDLEMGLVSDSKEDLDLELRLGYS